MAELTPNFDILSEQLDSLSVLALQIADERNSLLKIIRALGPVLLAVQLGFDPDCGARDDAQLISVRIPLGEYRRAVQVREEILELLTQFTEKKGVPDKDAL
jgi:hypothetical protein